MKNKLLKIIAVSTIFTFGIGALAAQLNKPQQVYAEQHIDNYAEYTYEGSYYAFVDNALTEGLQGTLRQYLSSLIFPQGWYTYSGAQSGQLGSVLQSADEDPTKSANMVLFYTRDSVSKRKSGDGSGNWNREHVWPQSLSNGHWGKEQAGTDILHIRPTWYDTNSARGNLRYGDLNKVGVKTYQGMTYGYANGSYFEPIDSVKGDVARIIMYVWTAYYDYYKDSGLLITKVMENYDTLLKWHTLDKPDALEGHRNDFAESSKQKNRNPFVDHPEYAWKIFGDNASADVKAQCKEVYPDNNELPPNPSSSSEPQSSCIDLDSSSSEPVITSEIPSSEPSSEISVASSEEPSILPASSNQQEEPKPSEKKGCNGSFIASVSLLSVSALIGLVFVFSKKK